MDLGTMELATTAEQQQRIAEKRELMRRAALSTIAMADRGVPVEAHYLRHCREFVKMNPALDRPLTQGAPA